MSTTIQLLDTPKRTYLKEQSTKIRAVLKDFERTFAAENAGRKPSKDDIKADLDIASKYKDYNKIRDVLAGKLDYASLVEPPQSPTRRRKLDRGDSGVGWTPRKRAHEDTPRKRKRPDEPELDNTTEFTSPLPALLNAIGPTPQRDGKILGLFDLLSNSAHSSKPTPSSRKRKLDTFIAASPDGSRSAQIAQTPSRRKVHNEGDLLAHLTGSPAPTPETGHRKLSRTPVSEGRKFMLSQFFATPSTNRYSGTGLEVVKEGTPLRDRVLGRNSDGQTQSPQNTLGDTPAYLRRSTSFKDRLLSASQPSTKNNVGLMSPPMSRAGPPTLKHFRSVSSMFSDFRNKASNVDEDPEDDLEDDLEALREMEDSQVNTLAKNSQQVDAGQKNGENSTGLSNPPRVWKKKGQKRTTRKVKMRPVQGGRSAQAPSFVAAGNDSDEDEDLSRLSETQPGLTARVHDLDSDEYSFDPAVDGASDFEPEGRSADQAKTAKQKTKVAKDKVKKEKKKSSTINPNATSHMNFRSLKIKNKNSKAKGRGRFGGRGRR